MKLASCYAVSLSALALLAIPASAQSVISAKSGLINYAEGQVFLNDQPVETSVTHYTEIKEGNVLRTDEGRAEVLLTPGVVLRLSDHASLRMITNRLIDTRLEMVAGSAIVEATEIAKETNVTIVVKNASVSLPKSGIYRVDAEPGRIKVFKGEASVEVAGQTTLVGSSRMMNLGTEVAVVEKFNQEETDALDRWSRRRGELMAMANVSAAKSLLNSGSYPTSAAGGMGMGRGYCNSYWGYNAWYGMMTYVPCSGTMVSPYGYRYWSPVTVTRVFYRPPANFGGGGWDAGFAGSAGAYSSPPMTSGGYSGTASSAGSGGFSGSSAAGGGSTAAASSGTSSVGHSGGAGGGAAGGGHGR